MRKEKTMIDYHDLFCWQKAMDLLGVIYRLTADWTDRGHAGLAADIRQAAREIPAFIVTACSRLQSSNHVQFFEKAAESCLRVQTLLEISGHVRLLDAEQSGVVLSAGEEVIAMLKIITRAARTLRLSPKTLILPVRTVKPIPLPRLEVEDKAPARSA
jgi:four helix bundle protein